MTPDETFRERLDSALGADTLTVEPVAEVVSRGRTAARRRARRRVAGGGVAAALVVAGIAVALAGRSSTEEQAVDGGDGKSPSITAVRSDGQQITAEGAGVRCTEVHGRTIVVVTNEPPEERSFAPDVNYFIVAFVLDENLPGRVFRLPTPESSQGLPADAGNGLYIGFFEADDRPSVADSGPPEYFGEFAGASGTVRVDSASCGANPRAHVTLDVHLIAENDVPVTVDIDADLDVDRPPAG